MIFFIENTDLQEHYGYFAECSGIPSGDQGIQQRGGNLILFGRDLVRDPWEQTAGTLERVVDIADNILRASPNYSRWQIDLLLEHNVYRLRNSIQIDGVRTTALTLTPPEGGFLRIIHDTVHEVVRTENTRHNMATLVASVLYSHGRDSTAFRERIIELLEGYPGNPA